MTESLFHSRSLQFSRPACGAWIGVVWTRFRFGFGVTYGEYESGEWQIEAEIGPFLIGVRFDG